MPLQHTRLIKRSPFVKFQLEEQEDLHGPTFWLEEIILPATHFLEATQDGDILGVICKMATAIVSNSQNSRIDELDEPTTGHDHIVVSWEFTGNDLNLPLLSKAIPGLVGIFLSRFQDQRHHCDLDYSIYLLEIMTQLLDTSTFSTVSELHNVYFMLVILHAIRYYLIKEPVHLDNLIGAFEAFLEETHGSPDYATHGAKLSLGLAMGLLDRSGSSNTPNAKDCDRVLQLYDNIYPLTFGDTRQTWDRVRSLALRFLSRSRRTFQDLTGALKHIRSVDDTVFISDKDAVPSDVEFLIFQLRAAAIAGDRELLLKVGEELKAPMSRCSLGAQFNMPIFLFWNDSEESLGDAIRTMKDRCRACSEEDPCRRLYSIVLAMALFSRFNRHSDDQDIKEALAFREPFGADEVFKVDLVLLALSEDVMGAKFGSKNRWPLPETVKTRAYFPNLFVKTDPRVFDRSSNAFKDISQWDVLGPDGRQLVSIFDALNDAGNNKKFHNLREWLQSRCRVEGDDPTEHLLDLCRLYDRRYRFTKQIEDLETSADYYLQALNHTNTLPYETYSLIDILFELERLKPGSIAPSQLLGRFDSLLEIAHNTATPLPYRLDSIASCFFFFDHPHVADQRISHALEMGNLALSLIEQQCWASPTPHASLSSRYIFRSLFSIAPNIIMLADPDNMPRAIEIFEMGRSLVWNQLENLRTPPNELASVTPGLSTQFLEISRTLERRMGFSHEVGIEPLGTYPQQLVEERNRIIEQIRALPGCENFLGPQSFNQLRLAAPVEGPVVILMSTIVDRSVAVVFFHANSSVLYLPITPDHLKRLNSSLRANPSTRDADYGGSSDDLFTPSTSTDMDSRVGVRLPRSKLDAYDILAELWDKVAKPVIDRIGEMMVYGEKGKGKAGIPKLEERGRIWWCCVGDFSFMPIHAAGIYRGSSPSCVSDYYISSYTPTLGALVKARMRPYPTNLKVLAAIQPNPGKGYSQLRNVQEELREIVAVVPPENLISLGDSDQPDFEGTQTTVKNVIDKFSEATVLHLACHGTQDREDPFKSGFILANGERLTIEEMIKHRLPNAHTAILSACHTSSNDAEQTDESMNLASTLLHLGFSSILATKWPMRDEDGPLLAKVVYSRLFNREEDPIRLCHLINRQVNATLHRNQLEAVAWVKHSEDRSAVSPQLLVVREPQVHRMDGLSMHDMAMNAASMAIEVLKVAKPEARALSELPLADIIDAFARKLRQEGARPERWATFVHVGI